MKLKLSSPSDADGREVAALFALALSTPEIIWPNDCPHCGAAMQFDLSAGAKAARRICPLGHTVTAADVLQRAKDEDRDVTPEAASGEEWPALKRGSGPVALPVPAAA